MTPPDETWTSDAPPTLPPTGRVLGGRWQLVAPIGEGAHGKVWRAVDLRGGGDAAVKLVEAAPGRPRERVAREIGALRLVEHVGVVPLLDHGEVGGEVWLVMPVVEGAPFPGRGARAWEAVRGPTLRLLDALRAVHARGLVHRDLKPANVLVRADGTVAVLDFGLARGRPLGATITATGAILGTPRYLAPEQVTGSRVDARADLYAVGCMLYEALAGAPPFPERGEWTRWLHLRVTQDAPSLALAAPSAPAAVVAAVDRLLARDPDRRPRSAGEALGELAAGAHPIHLPLLGRDAPLASALARLRAGRPVDVAGRRGVGVTRFVAEVEARLVAEGRVVHRLPPGSRPLESLGALVGPLPDTDAPAAAEARLRERLCAGEVVVVDRGDAVDHRSAAVVERARAAGGVLRAVERAGGAGGDDDAGVVVLDALTAADLRSLFAGPDRVLHLPEDASAALVRRTGGVPARVVAELHAWVEAGWARREGERFAVGRLAVEQLALDTGGPTTLAGDAPHLPEPLDRLLAWIGLAPGARVDELAAALALPGWEVADEVEELLSLGLVERGPHGGIEARAAAVTARRWTEEEETEVAQALAAAMAPGREGRLELLLRVGDGPAAAADALARAARPDVRVPRALVELRACLPLVRATHGGGATTLDAAGAEQHEAGASGPTAEERALVEAIARLAVAGGDPDALRAARADAERAGLAALATLLDATLLDALGDARRAGELAERLAPFADPEIDASRRMLPIRALSRTDPDAAEIALASLSDDSGPLPRAVSGALAGRRRAWLAQVRYRQGRFEDAAALHLACADGDQPQEDRIRALINAGGAFLDALLIDEAVAVLRRAGDEAAAARLPALEAFAEAWHRSCEYRAGRATTVDAGLLEALTLQGRGVALGVGLLTEAAVAWRAGDDGRCHTLGSRAADAFDAVGNAPAALLGRALAAARDRDADAAPLVAAALTCPLPRIAAQALALLASRIGPAETDVARRRAAEAADTVPSGRRDRRFEVLSSTECSRAVNAG